MKKTAYNSIPVNENEIHMMYIVRLDHYGKEDFWGTPSPQTLYQMRIV